MKIRHLGLAAAAALALGGCAHRTAQKVCADGVQAPVWRPFVTTADFDRLRTLRTSFVDAVTAAKAHGATEQIAAEGELLDPDRSLPDPVPPAGDYRCRTIKIGSNAAGVRDFAVTPRVACRVWQDGDAVRFAVTEGPQRPYGRLYPDGPARAVFLGTLELGDEVTPLRYGQDVARDMVGALDRVGARRWRLSLPYPHFETLHDVIEISAS